MSTSSKRSVEKISASFIAGSGETWKVEDTCVEDSEGADLDLETWGNTSTILVKEFESIKELYDVLVGIGARISKEMETVKSPVEGFVPIYE